MLKQPSLNGFDLQSNLRISIAHVIQKTTVLIFIEVNDVIIVFRSKGGRKRQSKSVDNTFREGIKGNRVETSRVLLRTTLAHSLCQIFGCVFFEANCQNPARICANFVFE